MKKALLFMLLMGVMGKLALASSPFLQRLDDFWQNLWKTKDQQAYNAMQKGDFHKAQTLFKKQDWRAAAAYKDANYDQALKGFKQIEGTEGAYNQGNALAKLGLYDQAIQAYDEALKGDPHHQDALFNKNLVQKLLKQQNQNQENNKNSNKDQNQKEQQEKPKSGQTGDEKTNAENEQGQKDNKEEEKKDLSKSENVKDQKENQQEQQAKKQEEQKKEASKSAKEQEKNNKEKEKNQSEKNWLRLIPDDPGGLLREKFLRDHIKRQQGQDS